MDVSVEEEVKVMAEYVEKEFGGCDVLFNNAGIRLAGRLLETPPADFDKIMSIDCRGVYLACYYFMPKMCIRDRTKGDCVRFIMLEGFFRLKSPVRKPIGGKVIFT